MFNFEHTEFRYEPYPIGLVRPIMDQSYYDELVDSFPPTELFEYKEKFGNKYTLSQKFQSQNYHDFIASKPIWRDLHSWIKSEDFIKSVDRMLLDNDIDMGFKVLRFTPEKRRKRLKKRAIKDLKHGRWPRRAPKLRTRFEFSMLRADGGFVIPHTDTPRKIITLIVSMIKPGEWEPSFGGGTDIARPKDQRYAYNYLNRIVPFEEIEVIDTLPFTPNQCVVFVKTFNSLHSVQPMLQKGSSAMRRSLTINIEKDD